MPGDLVELLARGAVATLRYLDGRLLFQTSVGTLSVVLLVAAFLKDDADIAQDDAVSRG